MHRNRLVVLAVVSAFAAGGTGWLARADTKPPAGDAAKGAQLFVAEGCGWCHSSGGRTAGKGPQLADTKRDDNFIIFRITNGKEGAMPAFGTALKQAQIADLIAYIRSLKPQ